MAASFSPTRALLGIGRRVERDLELLREIRVAADDGLPGDLVTLPATLRHHADPLGGDRHRVDLAIELQLTLDRLVQLCRHPPLLARLGRGNIARRIDPMRAIPR